MSALRKHTVVFAALAGMLTVSQSPAASAADGAYASAQAAAGEQVYRQHCARCHGAQLQGQASPPLVGEKFARTLTADPVTAPQLYEFITSHMPRNQPGILGDGDFLAAFAFLLSRNGYPSGDQPLRKETLGNVKLLPYPGPAQRSQ
jgi:mono/diheme cytochrome c family protein